MAENISNGNNRPRPTDHDRPMGYWVVKVIAILGIIGLAGFQLNTEQQVSPIVFALLATLAGGPEVADWLRK